MPQRALQTCRGAPEGCLELVRAAGWCPTCRTARSRELQGRRGTTTERGYGHTWDQLRRRILNRDPYCQICLVAASDTVDHMLPKSLGGTNAEDNLQGLCVPCHNRKTREEQIHMEGTPPAVTVLLGPPGAGKTTYVETHAGASDLVVDLDLLAVALGTQPVHQKAPAVLPYALAARTAVLATLGRPSGVDRAWLVTTKVGEASDLAQRFGAEFLVIEATPDECWRNVGRGDRRHQAEAVVKQAHRWWIKYSRPIGSTLIRGPGG